MPHGEMKTDEGTGGQDRKAKAESRKPRAESRKPKVRRREIWGHNPISS